MTDHGGRGQGDGDGEGEGGTMNHTTFYRITSHPNRDVAVMLVIASNTGSVASGKGAQNSREN